MKTASVLVAFCVLLAGLISALYFRPSASSSGPAIADFEAPGNVRGTTDSSTAAAPMAEPRSLPENPGLADAGQESLPIEDPLRTADAGTGSLLDQARPVAEYEAMSADQLDDEWKRLSRILTAEKTRRGAVLAEQGFKIHLGPSPTELSPASTPEEYRGLLTCFQSEVGVDGLYLVVLDPAADADLYELHDACSLVASLSHEKRMHDH